MILPDTTSTQDESAEIPAYNKDVTHMCLLGHTIGICLNAYGIELA
jgi:hypothetical protein